MNTERMRLSDAIHLYEAHTDAVVREMGLSRMEAYRLTHRESAAVARRTGVAQRMVEAMAADGIVAEMGRQ